MPIYALDEVVPELPDDKDFWIAPDANVIGKVRLHKGASIWFGCVLRGDNEWITIGENSNIQDLTVIHTDPGAPVTVGANVTVGHRVILHGAEIGEGSLVGMGSIVLNRAKIGKNCLIGAGSLIPEGKEYPDNTLIVGLPARVVKELSPQHFAILKMSGEVYVHNHRRFRDGLKRVD